MLPRHRKLHLETLEPRRLLDASLPQINEFLAVNDSGLADEDGATPDWIEIYNPGPDPVDLDGWHLTDKTDNLSKWTFDSRVLPADEYLVVFASNKNRHGTGPQGESHTNFKLDSDGEYLALVMPDGTVAHQFAPTYPLQIKDISYGVGDPATTVDVLSSGNDTLKFLIPEDGGLGNSWRSPTFGDGDWSQGEGGVGYQVGPGVPVDYSGLIDSDISSAMHGQNASAYIRKKFVLSDPTAYTSLTLEVRYDDGFAAYLNGVEIAQANAPAALAHDSVATEEHPDDQAINAVQIDVTAHLNDLLPGQNVLAIHGLNLTAADDDFLVTVELTGERLVPQPAQYFTAATPGAANAEGTLGVVDRPDFSVEHGYYDAPFQVELGTGTSEAEIRYTVDGSAPSATSGIVYTSPIDISTTTTVRAAAYKPGYISPGAVSQTYIFLDDVLAQTGAGFPSNWGHSGADYAVDPGVVFADAYKDTIKDDMKSLPALSLVMDQDDWFGSGGQGIYIQGESVERAVSAELIHADGSEGFQINASVQIQGGSSTGRWKVDKLSMRLKFKEPYGPTKLKYDLFETTPVDRFDTLIVDAMMNLSWLHPSAGQQIPAQYIRDQYVSDLQNAMGGYGTHGRYIHLYLNGLYWGLHWLHERADESFAASYLGGDKDQYDVIKHSAGRVLNGTNANFLDMLSLAASGLADPDKYQAMQNYLDVPGFVDYMITNFYTGNTDWPHHNWYASRHQSPEGRWRFHSWDAEHVLKGVGDDLTELPRGGPLRDLHLQLRANEEYQLLFADRLHRHFFNDGLLTADNAAAAYQDRLNQIDRGIVGESARWGDNRRPGNAYTRDVEWVAQRDWLLGTYFPQRSSIVFNQLRNDDLYPAVDAPGMNVLGGEVPLGFHVSLSASAGEIYYTTDGSDPRVPGGEISPTALLYVHQSFPVMNDLTVKARVLDNGQWSALTEAEFSVEFPSEVTLAITEMMYHPPGLSATEIAAGFSNKEDFEFIELTNTGGQPLDVSGIRFLQGIDFTFGAATLQPGEYTIVAKNQGAFEFRHGTGFNVAGQFVSGNLNNDGEMIKLEDAAGGTIHWFEYNDAGAWPGRADGRGAALEVVDVAGNYSDPNNWRSSDYGGSPGGVGGGPSVDVVISEVLTHTDPPLTDTIELHNTTGAPVDVSGWYLSDSWGSASDPDNGNYKKFRIPDDTVIPAGGYVFFDEDDFNPTGGAGPNDFALDGAHGDDVWLMQADAAGNLMRFADHVEFGGAANGESFGRWPDGEGILYPMVSNTFGQTNSGPRIGPVVISEIMYHPSPPTAADLAVAGVADLEPPLTAEDFEYVEIYNPGPDPVDLTNWRIRGGIDFDFPAGTQLATRGVLVILPFDRLAEGARFQAFSSHYGGVHSFFHRFFYGGYTGQLDNGGERIQLQRADEPPLDEPDFVPHLLEDQTRYNESDPWPTEADGTGQALARYTPSQWGHSATSWMAAPPSPIRFVELVDALKVADFTPTASGVHVQFDRDFDPAVLNLYDVETGLFGPADVTLVGDSVGAVTGSLVVGADSIAFVATGGTLQADTYTFTLRSAEDGFKDLAGNLLDGNRDGTPGGDYVGTFDVAPEEVVVSLPDFARGPGQTVNVPASDSHLPLTLVDNRDGGTGIKSMDVTIEYDPALLEITAASLDPDAPAGVSLTAYTDTPGLVTLSLTSAAAPFSGGVFDLITLTVGVLATAVYGNTGVLEITELNVIDAQDAAVPTTADNALHTAVYFGDATGNGAYSGLDAQRVARVAVGIDSGLEAFPLVDPIIVGDITGNGALSGLDAQKIALVAVGLGAPEIPSLPQPQRLAAAPSSRPSRHTLDESSHQTVQTSGVGDSLQLSPTPEVFLTKRLWVPIIEAVFSPKTNAIELPALVVDKLIGMLARGHDAAEVTDKISTQHNTHVQAIDDAFGSVTKDALRYWDGLEAALPDLSLENGLTH